MDSDLVNILLLSDLGRRRGYLSSHPRPMCHVTCLCHDINVKSLTERHLQVQADIVVDDFLGGHAVHLYVDIAVHVEVLF